jgi:opacity protein-like surface antigen
MKTVLLAFSSLVALTTVAAAADMQVPVETAPVVSWFGYVEGGYVFPTNSHNREFEPSSFDRFDEARTGGGGYGVGKLGYRVDDVWDVAAAFRYLKQSSGRISDDEYGWRFTGGQYWNVDVEAGYNVQQDDWSLRPFAGLRYQNYRADFTDQDTSDTYSASAKSWGLGPRVGLDVSKPVAEQVSFFASADASVLFGKIKADLQYGGAEAFSDSRTFGTAGAKAGLAWEFAPGVKLGAGYQVEYLSSIGYKTFDDHTNSVPSGHASQLIHGPFARLSFNY